MKTSRTREQRFLPWAYESQALTLALIDAELDGHGLVVDPRSQAIDLASEWSCARLELELTVPNRVLARVLAKPERASPPVAGLITLRCDKTHLRERVCLRPWAEADAGRFRTTLTLARDDLAAVVSLDAFLVRSTAAIEPVPGVASQLGTRLASARPLLLVIDEPPIHSGNYLDIQYRSFAHDPTLPASRQAALYRLELEREDPILYLNSDHERVRAALDSKGTTGRRARMRDLVFERVAVGVWSQLIVRAAARLVEDGELVYAWEQAVLEQWLPRLYPDQIDDDAQRRCLERDYQRLPQLLHELDLTLQTSGELAALATKLAEEL
jgi:hypothetical protein